MDVNEKQEIVKRLSEPKWWLMRRSLSSIDELTILSENDISTITRDMGRKDVIPATVTYESDKIIIEYPITNGCRLESYNGDIYVGARIAVQGLNLATVTDKNEDGEFCLIDGLDKLHSEWLSETEIIQRIMFI